MTKIDARGEQCPIPVIKAKEAIGQLGGAGQVEILVDNEIAVQNLAKMAEQKGYGFAAEKLGEGEFKALFTILGGQPAGFAMEERICSPATGTGDLTVVISADTMGQGDETLGRALLKGFIYALSKADTLPRTILFYNRGAFMTTAASDSVQDLKLLETLGVEILTCGTCLKHYKLTENLAVGSVTNMYTIVEKMAGAAKVIKP